MNFQAIRQIKGQKDAKNFPAKLDMFGTFNEIGGTYFNMNQKPLSDCKITDDTGEKHNVKLYGDAPPTNLLGTRCSFSLSAYDGTYQGKSYTGYSGFWNDRVPQQPQQAPQNTQQGQQQPAQGANAPQGAVTDAQILAFGERVLKLMESLVHPNATVAGPPTQPSGPNQEYGKALTKQEQEDDIPF